MEAKNSIGVEMDCLVAGTAFELEEIEVEEKDLQIVEAEVEGQLTLENVLCDANLLKLLSEFVDRNILEEWEQWERKKDVRSLVLNRTAALGAELIYQI